MGRQIGVSEQDMRREGLFSARPHRMLSGTATLKHLSPVLPVIVPPSHHVLVVGSGANLEPLDVLIGTKEEGVVARCVVRRPDQKAADLANWTEEKQHIRKHKCFYRFK